MLYLDSSALVKRYVYEPGSDAINARMGAVRTLEEIATSVVTFAEIHAMFARRFRENTLGQGEFNRIRMIFELDWADHISKLDVSSTILGSVRGLVERAPLRGVDAIHLASALSLRSAARTGSAIATNNKLIFATSDRQLKTAAFNLGFEVFDPEDS